MEATEKSSKMIGKRIRRYLFDGGYSRHATREAVIHLAESLPGTVVFGGMIRDLGLASARTFNSDIDLVSLADRAEILSVIARYNPVVNKFGGFRFAAGKQLFDIWSYQDTWAFKEGLVKPKTLQDLCLTTFFNLDGAFHPLKSDKIYGAANFISSLNSRMLDINLQENPAPQNMAVRAIKLAIHLDLTISSRLLAFILSNSASALWRDGPSRIFLELAKKHYEMRTDTPFRFSPQGTFDIELTANTKRDYPFSKRLAPVKPVLGGHFYQPEIEYFFDDNSVFASA